MKILHDFSLKKLHTFHFDYKSRFYAEIKNLEDLRKILQFEVKEKIILGNGSNSIFTKDFDGLIIHNKIGEIEIVEEDEDKILLKVGGGVLWEDLITFCVEKKFYGLENLVGIPGSVGAAPIQNIGAYGMEVSETITKVEFIKFDDLTTMTIANSACQFAYRDSIFKHELHNKVCITNVFFLLSKIPNLNLTYGCLQNLVDKNITLPELVSTIKKIRDEKIPNPNVIGNAGSFFKNAIIPKSQTKELLQKFPDLPFWTFDNDYDKISSAWMISTCGLKGFCKYGLKINEKSPLVILNEGCKDGEKLFCFIDEVKRKVFEKMNIVLSVEPNIF